MVAGAPLISLFAAIGYRAAMTRIKVHQIFCLPVALLALGSQSAAQIQPRHLNITVGQEPPAIYESIASPFTFEFTTTDLKSYCCAASARNINVAFVYLGYAHPITDPQQIGFTRRADADPIIGTTFGILPESRACFARDRGGLMIAEVEAREAVELPGDVSTFDHLRIRCDETTLYGGYNTAAAQLNFLEITNTSNSEIAVRVFATNEAADGTEVLDERFRVGISRRVDLDIHSSVPPGSFGPVRILHDGPPGAITAALSQYAIISTDPLEFRSVGRIPFKRRGSE